MRKAAVVTNLNKDKELVVTKNLSAALVKYGWEVHYDEDILLILDGEKLICGNEDICFVIGGDGTVLSAVDKYPDLPFIGVNLGRMGFLTEISPDEIDEAVRKITSGESSEEERMMLSADLGGVCIDAMNEVTVKHKVASGIGEFKVYVNDVYLAHYQADGIIVSTPTGSTAYNLSAGGPILSPACRGMIIQSICSHSLNSRGVVVSENEEIKIVFEKSETDIMSDGDILTSTGNEIIIKKSDKTVRFVHLDTYNFYNLLFAKIKQPNYLRGGLS